MRMTLHVCIACISKYVGVSACMYVMYVCMQVYIACVSINTCMYVCLHCMYKYDRFRRVQFVCTLTTLNLYQNNNFMYND